MTHDRRDHAHLTAIIAVLVLSVAVALLGVLWEASGGVPDSMGYQLQSAPMGAVVVGLVFGALATGELVRRLRRGPQRKGRHTR